MIALITQICLDLVTTLVIALLFVLKDKPELVKRLGFRITQFDIPYDPFEGSSGKVMVVKSRPNKPGQIPTWILPQTTFTAEGNVMSTKDNAEELGLPTYLYVAKAVLGFFGASRASFKGYRGSEVKVSFSLLFDAVAEGKLPWTWNKEEAEFELRTVEYSHAKFLSPAEALELLQEEAKKGSKPNPKRAKAYEQAFKALKEKFNHIDL